MMGTPSTYIIWVVSIALKFVLLWILIFRWRFVQWPNFTNYILFSAGKSLALVAVRNSQAAYFYAYYIGYVVESVFVFFVARELAMEVFNPWRPLPKRLGRNITLWGAAILLLCVGTSLDSRPALLNTCLAAGRLIERLSVTALFGIFAVMALASKQLGIPWRRHSFGVGAGFLICLSIESVTQSVLAPLLKDSAQIVRLIYMMGFPLASLVWIVYFMNPEPDRIPVSPSLLRDLALELSKISRAFSLTRSPYPVSIPQSECFQKIEKGSHD